MKKGNLIVIVAPSGSGKSTLIKRLKLALPELEESVSFTTRPPREGEVNGEHYNFISVPEFEKKISEGDFLEFALVHENYYGTSKSFVKEKIKTGTHLLFDLDVQGADNFKAYFKEDADTVFIAPPSLEELERRLRSRGTETEEAILTRLKNASSEILRKDDYDHLVINNDLEMCYNELEALFKKIIAG